MCSVLGVPPRGKGMVNSYIMFHELMVGTNDKMKQQYIKLLITFVNIKKKNKKIITGQFEFYVRTSLQHIYMYA